MTIHERKDTMQKKASEESKQREKKDGMALLPHYAARQHDTPGRQKFQSQH